MENLEEKKKEAVDACARNLEDCRKRADCLRQVMSENALKCMDHNLAVTKWNVGQWMSFFGGLASLILALVTMNMATLFVVFAVMSPLCMMSSVICNRQVNRHSIELANCNQKQQRAAFELEEVYSEISSIEKFLLNNSKKDTVSVDGMEYTKDVKSIDEKAEDLTQGFNDQEVMSL